MKFLQDDAQANTLDLVSTTKDAKQSAKTHDNQHQWICSNLELEHFEELIAIEPKCYSRPWSKEVLYNEFKNDISLRLGVFSRTKNSSHKILAGYCFNHLVLDELHILNLAIDPQYQRLGLGTYLLGSTLSEAKKSGVTRAFLEVRPSNQRACKLYAHFGFRQLGIRKSYYRDNSEDAIVMESYLNYDYKEQVDRSCVKC